MHYLPLAVVATGILLLFIGYLLRERISWRHKLRRDQASRVRQRLRDIPEWGRQLAYLRKINPFTFEELILDALELKGYEVIRNSRYTGDGGIDGQVRVNDQLYYIQAKRYQGYIQAAHVAAFAQLCEHNNVKGLFVHTGKTRPGTRQTLHENERLTLVSGKKLISLIMVEGK